jgi:hypothetical protein
VKVRTLARQLPEGVELPTEFLIFSAGVNDSYKGPALFDEHAAQLVMADYARGGVDMMIDLNHESFEAPLRPDSGDARGWAKLELRPDGSLWAVDVRWTPDGARRLAEKTQRYISPAFLYDDEDRVIALLNCAIVAMPATYDAPALVAASRLPLARRNTTATVRNNRMDPEQLKAAIDALTDGSMAKALGLDSSAKPSDILDAVQAACNALGPDSGPDSAADSPAPDPATAEMADAPVMNAFCKELGVATVAEGLEKIKTLSARVAGVDAEVAALDNAKRLDLVAELVKLEAETPATAWDGDPKARKLCARLAAEPVDAMLARVVALRARRPAPKTPPARTDNASTVKTYSKDVIAYCKKEGITPEEFEARKAGSVRRI